MDPAAEGLKRGGAVLELLSQTQYEEQEINAATDNELSNHWTQPGQGGKRETTLSKQWGHGVLLYADDAVISEVLSVNDTFMILLLLFIHLKCVNLRYGWV